MTTYNVPIEIAGEWKWFKVKAKYRGSSEMYDKMQELVDSGLKVSRYDFSQAFEC